MSKDFIRIGGAREHNLKNLTLSIPRDKLVVITGLSGSGKSSLAFDTIYAEGQRKYVESLSAYARQFLDQLQKPDVDFIEGLSPAIAIEQRSSGTNPRSTIATTTEIYDYLRLLFANVGQPHCPASGEPITHQTTSDIVDRILTLPPKTRVMLLAPVVNAQRGEFRDVIERLAREGFVRARVDGRLVELAANVRVQLDPRQKHTIEVVVDRLVIDDKIRIRLSDSVETALKWGEGRLLLLHQMPEARSPRREEGDVSRSALQSSPPPHVGGYGDQWTETLYSNRLYSPATGRTFDPLTPKHFSFNSPLGACPVCHGLGQKMVFDEGLIVPDPEKSLEQGAILPWRRGGKRMVVYYKSTLRAVAQHYGQNPEAPYKSLPDHFKRVLLHGSGPELIEFHFWRAGKMSSSTRPFEGVVPNLERLYQESESEFTKSRLKAFLSPRPCDACDGRRLKPEILAVTLGDETLASKFRIQSSKPAKRKPIPGLSIMDICALSIDEANEFFARLKLNEFQRKIAAEIIKEVRSRLIFLGNVGLGYLTLDRESGTLSGGEAQRIRLATQIGAGLVGVLYILDEPSIGLHQRDGGWLEILGARENNLQNIDARIPLGTLTCVTGVSGSGKSTLVDDILRRALFRKLYGSKERPGAHREINGFEHLDKVIVIDQTPIGRTPRSNPATYTGMFNHIRDLFAKLPAAKIRGYDAGRFSFNVKGGRCEKCQGDGLIKIEMHFLPPLYVGCEACNGKRYNRETLEITYKGMNIADVLAMTVDEAMNFFRAVPQLNEACRMLAEVGLGYIRLGQQATTLSGGEAQRVKLAAELGRKSTGQTLYILDEPTTGLHFHDVAKLLEVLFKLRASGNTLLVIEHNLDVIKTADWIIDLGPEGGESGGEIVAQGPPEVVTACEASYTGQFLRRILFPPAA